MKYAIIIEKGKNNYSAYVPDLPGCIATGSSVQETEHRIKDAISFHIEGMKEDGIRIPIPTTKCKYIQSAKTKK
ncbi:MAG: type II toxin-antitoxin system HicB family antitoxin [Candidatus Brocadiae bacterium]|nr:type II toxin-antitoxin system HicB family antitoxin [Candidatus Brocadiia bacterium]